MKWPRLQLKHVARFGYGDALPTDEGQSGPFSVFGSNGPYGTLGRANTLGPVVVIGRKGSYGKVNWSDEPCFASDTTFYIDASTTRHDLRWLYWLLQTLRLDEGSDEAAVPGLNREEAYTRRVPLPSPTAQTTIARFLDFETHKLDGLLAAKQRVLDLLAEKRKAIIATAVTRGLDPKVELRDSGVPWLGEIPAHWDVTRLKFIAHVQTGIALGKSYAEATTEYAYLRVANVQNGFIDLTEVKTMAVPEREAVSSALRKGDVLMNEGGDADKLGRGAIWDGSIRPCLHQNHVFALRPESVSSEWLSMWTGIGFAKAYFETRAKQSTNLASISSTNLLELPIAIPPDDEQRAIVQYIARETAKLDAVRAATERTIALLKERRSALIAAAVTGQLDLTKEGAAA